MGKHYEYFATVVTVVSNPGKPEVKLKGTKLQSSRSLPTIFSAGSA